MPGSDRASFVTPDLIGGLFPSTCPTRHSVMPDLIGHLDNMETKGYIYFMTNPSNKVLYIGVTNSLKRRVEEHYEGQGAAFTSKYKCAKLVYYETFPDIEQAIAREKQLKHFKRAWKDELVSSMNPDWQDLGPTLIADPAIV